MTDGEAIVAYKNGDEEGLRFLFDSHKSFVYNCCLRILKNPDDAEDVAQNTWLHLCSYLIEFNQDCSFRTIAYRTARDRSIDFLRKKESESEEILLPPEELSELLIYSSDSPDTDLAVNDMLRSLAPEDRALVIAKVYDGWSDEELAARLNQSESTLRRQINRVFERLKAIHKDRIND
jgi:RNA polymerase sigma-70 factor (ECF subfamily)